MSVQLAAPQQAIIVGNPVRPAFNGQSGHIDLNDYVSQHPIPFKGCTFLHFEFLDLETVNLDTENFANVGIRENFDGDDGMRIDELEVSFTSNGFDTSDWPPSVDSTGNWIDGRGRVTAAINNNERWIPVAVYSREDSSLLNTILNGQLGNLYGKRPSTPSKFRDIVNSGVHLVNNGVLEPTIADIDKFLLGEDYLGLKSYFKPELITRMKHSIIEESTRDESLILRKSSTKEWHSWINRNLELDKKDYVLVSLSEKSYDTYIQRVWCESILPAIIKGTDPVDIIFYTNLYRPSEARSALAKSMIKLDSLYDMSFALVKSQLSSSGVDLEALLSATGKTLKLEEKPYSILGAIPQIVGDHDFEAGELITVDKY